MYLCSAANCSKLLAVFIMSLLALIHADTRVRHCRNNYALIKLVPRWHSYYLAFSVMPGHGTWGWHMGPLSGLCLQG